MKHFVRIGAVTLGLLLPVFILAGLVQAQTVQTGTNVTVPKDRVVDSTLFSAGNAVDIAGEVNGDVICAGQSVTVSGTVRGDVICAGQTVHISGKVEGSVRLAGQTVTVGGQISRNATVVGQSITLESNGQVTGDFMAAGTTVTTNGSIGRDLGATAGQVTINNSVGRNVRGTIDRLTLDKSAKVAGEVVFTSNNNATVNNGAQTGQITRNTPKVTEKRTYGMPFAATLLSALYMFVALLVIALVIVLLVPQVVHATTQQAVDRLGRTILIGVLTAFAVPVVLLALMITLIGIPLAILLFLLWMVAAFLAGPFSAYYVGRLILRRSQHPIVIMLLGSVVLLVIYFIPILGFLVVMAAYVLGIGMIVSALWHVLPRPGYRLAPPAATKTK